MKSDVYNHRVDFIEGQRVRREVDLESGGIVLQQKFTKGKPLDVFIWGVRIAQSIEKFDEDFDFDRIWDDTLSRLEDIKLRKIVVDKPKGGFRDAIIQRFRRRTSFKETNRKSKFYGLRFDLTIVNEYHTKQDASTFQVKRYEVEIERIGNVDVKTFEFAIKSVLMWSQNISVFNEIMPLYNQTNVVRWHNELFELDSFASKFKTKDAFKFFSNYWNKPTNLKLKDMLNSKFDPWVTIKLDGVRKFLFIHTYGTFLVGPPYDILKIGEGDLKLNGTLVDGEFMFDKSGSKSGIPGSPFQYGYCTT